jgi:hypothetical protein
LHHYREIEGGFQELMDFCDFRQCAMYGKRPFRDDPYKAAFFAALFEIPELLHATVRRSNDGLISAHIGFRNRDQVVLGILVHSPLLAEHSPGTLHLLLLGQLLAQEGVADLDLTPGGAYKDRFATHHDQVDHLTVYFSRARFEVKKAGDRAVRVLKAGLEAFSISPQRAREILARGGRRLRMLGRVRRPGEVVVSLFRRSSSHKEALFRWNGRLSSTPRSNLAPVRRDSVQDLLAYRPAEPSDPPISDFLRRASSRLAEGDHVYSHVRDGVLVGSAWLRVLREAPTQLDAFFPFQLPAGSILFYDFYTPCDRRDPDLLGNQLAQMLQDSTSEGSDAQVHAVVPHDDALVRTVLGKSGFEAS